MVTEGMQNTEMIMELEELAGTKVTGHRIGNEVGHPTGKGVKIFMASVDNLYRFGQVHR